MIYVSVALLVTILGLNYKYLGDHYTIFNPVSFSIYVWILVLLMHCYLFDSTDYTSVAYCIVAFGNAALAIGFWLFAKRKITFFIRKPQIKRNKQYDMDKLRTLLFGFMLIEIVRLLYSIYLVVYKLAGSWNMFLTNATYVRKMYLAYNGGVVTNVFEFFCNANALIAYVIVGILLSDKDRKKKNLCLFAIWSACEMAYALITMSKMCFILYVIVVATVYINNIESRQEQRKMIRRYLPALAVCIFVFLMIIGMQRNYGQNDESLLDAVFTKIGIYFSGPTEALGKYINNYQESFYFGGKTFNVVARIFSRLGMNENVAVLAHGEDIDIGYDSINAYTWFKVFFQDFSYAGVILLPLLIGILAGIFYNKGDHSFSRITCNAWLTAIIVMSFYTFMFGQTIYIFILIYAYILERVLKAKMYIKQEIVS